MKKVAEILKKAIIHKRSRSGSSIWLERRPVTAEVASSSLVRIAIYIRYEQRNSNYNLQSSDCRHHFYSSYLDNPSDI